MRLHCLVEHRVHQFEEGFDKAAIGAEDAFHAQEMLMAEPFLHVFREGLVLALLGSCGSDKVMRQGWM